MSKRARLLQAETGGRLLRLETAVPYTGSYSQVVDQGQREVERGYEPPLKPLELDPADYDVIAVGTPTWWYTMAPAVKTFLHRQSFAGKTVVPFMTNGGWPGHVITDMKKPAPARRLPASCRPGLTHRAATGWKRRRRS